MHHTAIIRKKRPILLWASLVFLFLGCFSSNLLAQSSPGKNISYLLVGTFSTSKNLNGIHVYRFDRSNESIEEVQPVTELSNASYLAVSIDGKNVYAVSEATKGSLNAYSFDAATGKLLFLNRIPVNGAAYVSVLDKKMAVTADYGGGSVTAVPLKPDGSLEEERVQSIPHEGHSKVKGRQDAPHVHSTVWSPDKKFLFTPDLGNDRVYQYELGKTGKDLLVPGDPEYLSVNAGGGPRHLVFHPNGKWAYLVLELTGAVMAFDYHKGKLQAKQTVSMLSPDFKGAVGGADIHVSPDGKFLYASNRGAANEIAVYAIGKKGVLSSVGRQSVLGRTPRNFVIDASGTFLLVANQDSNKIILFKRDKKTGLLASTGKTIDVDKPVCLKFIPF